MDERVQKAKNKLLELGYQDNKYLADYLELIERNISTVKNSISTQGHHVIPVKEFKDDVSFNKDGDSRYRWHASIDVAELDDSNFRVNLLYKDHLAAHNLLALCRDADAIQKQYEDTYIRKHPKSYSLNKSGITKISIPKYIKTEKDILEKLDYYTNLYNQASDERAAHKYRSQMCQWKAIHRKFLFNEEAANSKHWKES